MMNVVNLTNGKNFVIESGNSLINAALSAGVYLPYSCNTGRCGSCKCRVLKGKTIILKEELGLSAEEKNDGWILSCARSVQTDVTVEIEDLSEFLPPPIKTFPCRINAIDKLSGGVMCIKLRIPPNSDFNAMPGQYIDLIGPGGVRRSYSLANYNSFNKYLEFHIREVEGGVMSDYWFSRARINDLLRLNGPMGTFFLRNLKNLHLVFLATGTGIAPVKAMLEKLAVAPASDQALSVTLYWGGREPQDLYCDPRQWYTDLKYNPVLSRASDEWLGSRGYVQKVFLDDRPDLKKTVVYACGSSDMIRSAKAELIQSGLPEQRFYSDAFVPSGMSMDTKDQL